MPVALRTLPFPAVSTTTCSTCDIARNTALELLVHGTPGWDLRCKSEFQTYSTTSPCTRVLAGESSALGSLSHLSSVELKGVTPVSQPALLPLLLLNPALESLTTDIYRGTLPPALACDIDGPGRSSSVIYTWMLL